MVKKSLVGGILTIVAGAWGFMYALMAVCYGVMMFALFRSVPNGPPIEFSIFFAVMAGFYALFFTGVGVLAVVGGIFAVKQKRWGWALAGAIAGNVTFMWIGVIGVIFISMARDEFKSSSAPAAPPADPTPPVALPAQVNIPPEDRG